MARPQLLALLVLVLLAAAGPASAATKKVFNPPGDAMASPMTRKLASLRSTSAAITDGWNKLAVKTAYQSFLTALGKPQTTLNSAAKQATFKSNLAKILALNKNANVRWTAAPNHFTDLSTAERAAFLGLKRKGAGARAAAVGRLRSTVLSEEQLAALPAPEIVAADLEAASVGGVVSATGLLASVPEWSMALPDVKNQGPTDACKSGWAFAAAAAAEAARYIQTGDVLPLSEKALVDCAYSATKGDGCQGGWLEDALKYIVAKGLPGNSTYPYYPKYVTCPAKLPASSGWLKSYKALPGGNEGGLVAYLNNGPIAAAVTVDDSWFSYSGGVFSSASCSGAVNHAVLIVGAGTDDDTGAPYWLIRNSWGPNWGEGGYMRLQRGVGTGNGICNVAQFPFQGYSTEDDT